MVGSDDMPPEELTYKSKEDLEHLYIVKCLTQDEIADFLNVSKTTICRWMKKHGIETRNQGSTPRQVRVSIGDDMYASISQRIDGERVVFRTHRLVAFAHFDGTLEEFSSYDVVHHKDGCKFNNAPENLEVLTHEEHNKKHESWMNKHAN